MRIYPLQPALVPEEQAPGITVGMRFSVTPYIHQMNSIADAPHIPRQNVVAGLVRALEPLKLGQLSILKPGLALLWTNARADHHAEQRRPKSADDKHSADRAESRGADPDAARGAGGSKNGAQQCATCARHAA